MFTVSQNSADLSAEVELTALLGCCAMIREKLHRFLADALQPYIKMLKKNI